VTDAYIALRPCGCIVGAVVDNPEHSKDVAKDVAEFIRAGCRIERRTNEEVRTQPWKCPAHQREAEAQLTLGEG
jgi:hypothetical protein